MTLTLAWRAWWDEAPERVVLVDAGSGRTLTGADVLRLTGRAAARLHADGVRAGDRVLLSCSPSVQTVLAYVAVLRLGAVVVPANTAYTASELEHIVGDVRPAVAVLDDPARAPAGLATRTADGLCADAAPDLDPVEPVLDAASARRPRTDRVHLRNDRAAEGRDAQPRQPARGRAGAGRGVGVDAGRPAAARAADVPHARARRGDQRLAHGGCVDGACCRGSRRRPWSRPWRRATRPCSSAVPTMYALLRDAGRAARPARPSAARQRFRAAGPCALRRRRRDRRPGPGRALRHERDRHAHLEPGARGAPSGFRGAAASGRPGAAR